MIIKNLLGHKFLLIFVIAYTSLITWASLSKLMFPVKIMVEGADKIGHFIAYFVFTIVWFLFFFYSEKFKNSISQSLVKASVFCFIYGLLMEVMQVTLTNYRYAEWFDILANTSGIIIAVLLLKLFGYKLVIFKNHIYKP